MATHSGILAWRIPWTEEPGGLQSMGHKESDTTEWLSLTYKYHMVAQSVENTWNMGDPGSIPGSERSLGEGNGNPLQYSCLEDPIYRGAWWAIVHGVTELDTTEWLTLYKRNH